MTLFTQFGPVVSLALTAELGNGMIDTLLAAGQP